MKDDILSPQFKLAPLHLDLNLQLHQSIPVWTSLLISDSEASAASPPESRWKPNNCKYQDNDVIYHCCSISLSLPVMANFVRTISSFTSQFVVFDIELGKDSMSTRFAILQATGSSSWSLAIYSVPCLSLWSKICPQHMFRSVTHSKICRMLSTTPVYFGEMRLGIFIKKKTENHYTIDALA